MIYEVKEHDIISENYLVMEPNDFDKFVLTYELPLFKDDKMVFTYWNKLQIVKKWHDI